MEPYSRVNHATVKAPLSRRVTVTCDPFALPKGCIRAANRGWGGVERGGSSPLLGSLALYETPLDIVVVCSEGVNPQFKRL